MNLSNASVNYMAKLFQLYGPGATLKFYRGTLPATADTAVDAADLLATVTFPSSSWSTPSAGETHTAAAYSGSVVLSDTIGFARMSTATLGTMADFTVGLAASGADIELAGLDVLVGDVVQINSMSVTISK